MNKYLNIWIKSGAYFGLCMGTIHILQQGNYISGAITGIAAGFIFGGAMVGVTFFADRGMAKKGIINDSTGVDQSQSLRIDLPIQTIAPVVQEAILILPKVKIKSSDQNSFTAKTGVTWKSFGEDIIVSLKDVKQSTIIEIRSKSSLKTTIVDYGKNLENVQAISAFIKQKFDGAVSDYT